MSSNQERHDDGSNSKDYHALKKTPAILGSILLIIGLFLISQLFLIALVPIPLTFIILRRGKIQWVIGAFLLAGTVAVFAKPDVNPLYHALIILGWLSFVFAELFERGLSSERIILTGSAVSIILLFFFLGLYSFRASTAPDAFLRHEIDQSMSKIIDIYEQGGMEPDQVAMLKKTSPQIEESLISVFPAILIVILISVVLINYFLLRRWLQFMEFPVEDRRPFWQWIVPDWWVWLFIVSGILWYFLKVPLPSRIGLNFLVVASYLYLIQGVAIIIYFFQKGRIPSFFRYLGLVVVLFIPGSYIFLTLGGLFDNWIDFRKLRVRSQETGA
ncbi:MAG: YybS family protein [bacterium]